MTQNHAIKIPRAQLEALCQKHHICRLALFGSALHENFRADSDLDVLVEFEVGHVPGLGFIRIQQELSDLLARNVDLNTPAFLSRYFRDQVLAEAEVVYDQK